MQFIISHPSALISLSADLVRPADQEQADIEAFPRDSGKQSKAGISMAT